MNEQRLAFLDERYPAMPWDSVDTVIFDIGNVLLRFDPPAMLRAMFDSEEKRELLLERVFKSPYWLDMDRGLYRNAQAAPLMAGGDAALEKDIAYLLAHWCEQKTPIEEGIAVARECKARGKQLCLLSNYHYEGYEWNIRHHAFFSLFDIRMISCYVHQIKPDAEFYQTLLATGGIDASRAVFIDDTQANVLAGMKEGIAGIWYHEPGQLSRFFGL